MDILLHSSLLALGFSDKEAVLYRLLLQNGPLTASDLSELSNEKRTNVYALLDTLLTKGVITADNSPVKRFEVSDPRTLETVLELQHAQYRQAASTLRQAMPSLKSQYSLTVNKPGVLHMAGTDGFMRLLDDMVRSQTEVLLIASNDTPKDERTTAIFREKLIQRKEAGVTTRALFHRDESMARHKLEFAARGIDVRFLGTQEFKAEIIVYENNVAYTVYDPSLVVTIVTNSHIAATMRLLFEELWHKSDPDNPLS